MPTKIRTGRGVPFWLPPFPSGTWVRVLRLARWASVILGSLGCGSVATAMEAAIVAPVAPPAARVWSLNIRWDNDTVANTDRYYTNGVAVSLAHTGESWADPVMDRLLWRGGRRTVTYALSQMMFTPDDTHRPTPDPADRPYAGVLTFGLGLHADRGGRYDGLTLILGMVGPAAGAGETQRQVHRIVGSSVPQGWDAQLHNEPIINLVYEHRRKYRLLDWTEGWALEAVPIAGVTLGTLLTEGQVGGQVRLGYRIPDDFGMTLLRGMSELPPPRQPHREARSIASTLGFYLYGGVAGNVVLRDLTLDGNTFRDSPSVDKKWFVPVASVGVSLGTDRVLATFSYVFLGKEFQGQRGTASFGRLTVTYCF